MCALSGVESATPCSPTRPVPVMHVHGSADRVIEEQGGTFPFLTGEPRTTSQKGDSTCVSWEACAQGATVTRCGVQGGGHTWPGGPEIPDLGYTTKDLDATREPWRFFAAHPRP